MKKAKIDERTFNEVPQVKDLLAINRVFNNEHSDDRTIAIASVAHIEAYLARYIRASLSGLNSDLNKTLFSDYGPLATIKSRIDIAKAMGLISGPNRKDLIKLARIRNRFAHNIHVSSFDAEELKDLTAKFNDCLPLYNAGSIHYDFGTAKGRFVCCSMFYIGTLHNIDLANVNRKAREL